MQAEVNRDVYFVDYPANPRYAFIISAAPIEQYTAPIGPDPRPASSSIRPTVTDRKGESWEFRGITPGGMVRLWALDGACSLTLPPADVDGLRELARPLLADRGAEYDRDDCQTLPLAAIVDILATGWSS